MTYEELMADAATQKLLEACAAKVPGKRLRPIDTAAGVVVCCNPSRAQFNYFQASLWDDDKTVNAKAHENLFRACVVHPEPAVMAQWIEDWPGILVDKDVISEFRILYGAAKDTRAKR